MTQETKTSSEPVAGAARIGRSGKKLHPALKFPGAGIIYQCNCSGTHSGAARGEFFPGLAGTCKS